MSILKIIITIALVTPYIVGYKVGYTDYRNFGEHVTFVFSHANIFHLLCNLLAFWCVRGSMHIIPAFAINLLASYIAPCSSLPTMGASGVLFAVIGIKWGTYFANEYFNNWVERDIDILKHNAKKFLLYVIAPMALMVLLPNVNYALHFCALCLAMIYAFIKYTLSNK